MADAKLAPNLQQWQIDHANEYLSSGGAKGHMFKRTPRIFGDERCIAAAHHHGTEIRRESTFSRYSTE